VSPATAAPTLWNYDVCAQYPGVVGDGATVYLPCSPVPRCARYPGVLSIQVWSATERLYTCPAAQYPGVLVIQVCSVSRCGRQRSDCIPALQPSTQVCSLSRSAQYPGEVGDGATVYLPCSSCMPPRRYLIVQVPTALDHLNFCEIEVYARRKLVFVLREKERVYWPSNIIITCRVRQ